MMFDLWDAPPNPHLTTDDAAAYLLRRLKDEGCVIVNTRDEATVERVAEALRCAVVSPEELLVPPLREYWRELARAALGALAKGDDHAD